MTLQTAAVETQLLADLKDEVLTLTLNRPHSLNSVTSTMLADLAEALVSARKDPAVRAIVLTGSGRAFCAGQDLTERGDIRSVNVAEHLHAYYEPVLHAMRETDKPIIAAINGVAAGAGMSLALAADFRIASECATFVQAFVGIGLVPDAGATYLLPRIVGWGRATELMMLGETIDANTAARYGLVYRVVTDADFPAAVADLASRLARGPRSIGLIKQLLFQSSDAAMASQLANEAAAQAQAAASADFSRGLEAFFAKIPPQFEGN